MENKKMFLTLVLALCLLLTIGLTSCNLGREFRKFTYNDYLTIKYPKDCILDNKESNGNTTNTFVLNEQNFVIISEEKLANVDKNTLDINTLKQISRVYADPFLKQGYEMDSEEITNIGDNPAYKITYTVDNHTVGYIFWFEKNSQPPTLYKIMYVYDPEHKDTVMQMIDSVELPYK